MGTPKLRCWTLRLQAKDGEHGFKLTDKDQEEDLEVQYQAESRYNGNAAIAYIVGDRTGLGIAKANSLLC